MRPIRCGWIGSGCWRSGGGRGAGGRGAEIGGDFSRTAGGTLQTAVGGSGGGAAGNGGQGGGGGGGTFVVGPDTVPLVSAGGADALVVVAGMEGALPSVVGGLVDCPVIAVPTSIGYGANFSGLAALLGMLNSCASNVVTVNIDAGFNGGHVAGLIARRAGQARASAGSGSGSGLGSGSGSGSGSVGQQSGVVPDGPATH